MIISPHIFIIIQQKLRKRFKILINNLLQQQNIKNIDISICFFIEEQTDKLQQDINNIQLTQTMFTFQKIKQQNLEYEEQDVQLSQDRQISSHQSQFITKSLYIAKTKFLDFIDNLGQYRTTQIRQDIMIHCQQINKNRKVISTYNSPQSIVKLISIRIQKMLKNKKIKKNWSQEDIKILVWIVSKYSQKHGIENIDKQLSIDDWKNISYLIPGVNHNICMYRWLSLKKVNLSNNSWTDYESKLLQKLINDSLQSTTQNNMMNGSNWRQISQKLYQENKYKNKVYRSPKQCKQHWNCFLNPNLKKGPWQNQEDILLLNLIYKNKGSKRWSEIVHYFQGRTQNALKNRYNLLLQKQKRLNKSNKNQMGLIYDYIQAHSTKKQGSSLPIQSIVEQKMPQTQQKIQQFEIFQQSGSYFEVDNQQSKKIDNNFIQSSSSTMANMLSPSTSTRIHFLSSYQQIDFLSWMKERTDIKKCCLKNGSFEIQQ